MMLKPGSNIRHLRLFLKEHIGKTSSPKETDSLIQIIFNHFGLNYLDSFSDPDKPLNQEFIPQINEIADEIANNRPIQYILGYTFFYELRISVDENVLIPRPETEEMIDRVIKSTKRERLSILDIGTGSGCIAIALKKHFPLSDVMAIDNSSGALDLARENAVMNRTEIRFQQADFLTNPSREIPGRFDLIISNPPYVTQSEKTFMDPNVLDHEPEDALFVQDSDPVLYFRAIASFAAEKLSAPGDIWVEINENYGDETVQVFSEKGFKDVLLLKDIHGKNRFIHVKVR